MQTNQAHCLTEGEFQLEQERIEDLVTEIENTNITEDDVATARAFLSRFTYTATALTALHVAMRELEQELGDENIQASSLLLFSAGEMAKIDAVVS